MLCQDRETAVFTRTYLLKPRQWQHPYFSRTCSNILKHGWGAGQGTFAYLMKHPNLQKRFETRGGGQRKKPQSDATPKSEKKTQNKIKVPLVLSSVDDDDDTPCVVKVVHGVLVRPQVHRSTRLWS